ncbi:hypothetical protein [Streptomyces lunalinharesii]|uniref:Uncharacterized protein n=1 Tax=Streptomyces lunalinharesii TaxID=333384 RepID=A0ABN3RFQ1_9ACTN
MISRRTLATLGVTTVALGAGLATAAPATAGGIGVFASPAFDNTCITLHRTTRAVGRMVNQPAIGSNLLQAPVQVPYQHCGGAEVEYVADAGGF